jgi:serine protease Do
MRRIPTLATLATLAALSLAPLADSAGAQDVRVLPRRDVRSFVVADDRPMIGVTTAAESERGDTLGLRIEEVTKDSPAEKAGLKVGDRLQAVNGVSLRADRADAGEDDYSGVLNRRLQREVQKTKAGESVELRVFSGSQSRTVRVTPAKASDVMAMPEGFREEWKAFTSDRAALGLQISATGSVRDTIGVFVTAVSTGGPAEKAGIVEGDRIAAINGVSLRVAREDAEDRSVGHARVERLQREVAKLEAGQAAELTVVTAGRSRTVRVTAVKAGDLPDEGAFTFFANPEGSFRIRTPEAPMGGTFRYRSPDTPDAVQSGRRLEMVPRMNELRYRLEAERAAGARSAWYSRRTII